MSLLDLRTAIVASITSEIPTLRTVQPHGGRFNLAELKRWAVRSPAVLVACLGGPITREAGQAVCDARFVAYILTPGTSAAHRDVSALALGETLAGLIAENKWGYANAQAPQKMRLENLYGGPLDSSGVALWVLEWRQAVDVAIYDASGLDDFFRLDTKYDLAPLDGVTDAEDLIHLGGTLMSAYGHINISGAVATSIAIVGTYQKAAGTTELNLAADCDMPVIGRLRHTGTVAKPFLATASMSVTVSSDTKVTLAFAKNGVADADTEVEQEVTAAGGVEAFSLKHIVSLDANEYLEVWVKAGDLVNVTLTKMSLVLAAT